MLEDLAVAWNVWLSQKSEKLSDYYQEEAVDFDVAGRTCTAWEVQRPLRHR